MVTLAPDQPSTSLPIRAGVCLKHQHYEHILDNRPDVGWFEVHAENYLGDGGKPLSVLNWVRGSSFKTSALHPI
ncbi:MAG: DUF692 family multinuclear iron-containing protein [Pseudomonadota bacterium]